MSLKAEIITIGDELLIGQVIDTNSAWIGEELNKIGIQVNQITSISDNKEHILKTIQEAQLRAQIILITGGLGPTKDDITKKTLCEFFNTNLTINQDVLNDVTQFFKERNRDLTDTNKEQALVPDNCIVVRNSRGTAPGMWFNIDKNISLISMPGVPYEMKTMMQKDVIPLLKEKYKVAPILHKTILTQGIGESFLADKIGTWEDNLPLGMKLAYLPAPGLVRLRLSYYNAISIQEGKKLLNNISIELANIVNDYVYGYDNDTIVNILAEKLIKNNFTLSVAESCSGGLIAQQITNLAGASTFFTGGIIAYSNNIKIKLLQVEENTILKHGAVSELTTKEMAFGIIKNMNTTYGIATSGIAGPSGASEDKPVGTVCISVAKNDGTYFSKTFKFANDRTLNIQLTALYALHMLNKFIDGKLQTEALST